MKLNQIIVVGIALWLPCLCTQAQADQVQPKNTGSELPDVGDKVPDLLLSPIVNYSKTSARISDYNNQLLILDFWATWCLPCVRAFPKLDSLQRKFNGRVQFMPVTYEKKEKIEKFYGRLRKQNDYVLPTVVEDTMLAKHFSGKTGSLDIQYAWIRDGEIVAFTRGNKALTKENLERVLSGKELDADDRQNRAKGEIIFQDFDRPVLVNDRKDMHREILYHSVITPFVKGLRSGVYVPKKTDKFYGIRLINVPLASLYAHAFQTVSPDVMEEMADPLQFNPPLSQRDSSNLYCYELIIPKDNNGTREEFLRGMQEDLKSAFGFVVARETRKVNGAVLRQAKKVKLSSSGKEPVIEVNNFYITVRNQPMSKLVSSLAYYLISPDIRVVVDETGITGNIDLSMDVNLSDPQAVVKALKEHGLELSFEEVEKEMVIIKDGRL